MITEPQVTPSEHAAGAPAPTPATATEQPPGNGAGLLKISVLYDNYAHDPQLQPAWGFAALIETGGHLLLFDTGGDGRILLNNMRLMGVEPARIEAVVLSHIHNDHVGGLDSLLELAVRPTVYLLPSFPEAFKDRVRGRAEVVEVSPGLAVVEGAFSTGEMAGAVPEQALVLRLEHGLVILTGCAHPGVARMVERAQELFGGSVHLVLGGFHLGDHAAAQLQDVLSRFRELGVVHVAPCHCTGDRAIEMFRQEYRENFHEVGVGRVLLVGP